MGTCCDEMQIPNMEGSAGLHGEDTDMAAPHPRAVLKADTFLCTTRGRCVIFLLWSLHRPLKDTVH